MGCEVFFSIPRACAHDGGAELFRAHAGVEDSGVSYHAVVRHPERNERYFTPEFFRDSN